MNFEHVRIAWACFLGGSIGTFLAILFRVHHPYLYWIGFVIGALVGYVTYRFKEVVQTTLAVANELTEVQIVKNKTAKIIAKVKSLDFREQVAKKVVLIGIVSAFISFFCSLSILSVYFGTADPNTTAFWKEYQTHFILSGALWMFLLGGVFTLCEPQRDKESLFVFGTFVLCSPLLMLVGLVGLLSYLFFRKVVPRVFVAIHSDFRLLCATDSFLGAVVGYCFERGFATEHPFIVSCSVLIGGLVGALFGILNYELVSVRWLKLVPKPT